MTPPSDRGGLELTGKRVLDLALTLPALVALAPVLLAVAAAIRMTMGAPVLFRQERPGLYGRPFTLFKFRTMTPAPADGSGSTADVDRLTSLGSFLRRTSLDELPELFNVLRGEMSLVGPRPLLMQYLPLYTARQARRHEVPPGLTGWAQVQGRNRVSWEEKFELDVWYVENRSLWLDLRIIARTVRTVLQQEGISQEGHATAEPFRGTSPHGHRIDDA